MPDDNLQVQMSPSSLPRMQRTTSTPSQPQPLSSWRPDLPEEATQDTGPASSPHGFSQQPLPSSSPTAHAMPSRTPSYRTTGTEPVCLLITSELFSAPLMWYRPCLLVLCSSELPQRCNCITAWQNGVLLMHLLLVHEALNSKHNRGYISTASPALRLVLGNLVL